MNQLRLAYPTGSNPNATIQAVGSATAQTVTLSELSTGYYVGTFPTLAAGTYDIIYRVDGEIVGSETLYWDGASIVDAIDLLNVAPVTVNVTSPLAEDHTLSIVKGDDYLSADNRAINYTLTGVPSLVGATVKLTAISNADSDLELVLIGMTNSSNTVSFDIHSSSTARLVQGSYSYDIQATLPNRSIITLVQGNLTLLGDVSDN